ncbi:MAG: hypothetical protein HP491_19350 [Nitrospira sp.]|nr:hypothetical protein [Nitrospira sp.]MBH0183663.1 hypothetical protein [Nitrospira sp.]MBH0186815.1 hypothetical protein [Nitrospira sp.]
MNEAPVLGGDVTVSVAENQTAVGTFAATDVDAGDTVAYGLSGADAGLFTISTAGGVSFSSAPDYETGPGPFTFVVTATDALVNVVPGAQTVAEDTALATISYQGNLNFTGADTLTVVSTDSNAVANTDTVAITVSPVAYSAPSLATNTGSIVVQGLTDVITSGELQVTDLDNTPDQLVYTAISLPRNGHRRAKSLLERRSRISRSRSRCLFGSSRPPLRLRKC